MKSGLNFLVAARQCEIGELEQLALTSELVSLIARLIHALQKERGLSNVYLASGGARLADARRLQLAECQQVELEVRQRFDQLDTAPRQGGHGARLFSRIAWVLHALDALPGRARPGRYPEAQPGRGHHLVCAPDRRPAGRGV
jgi:hypothetical protein